MSRVFDFQIYLAIADSILTLRSVWVGDQMIVALSRYFRADSVGDFLQLIFRSSSAANIRRVRNIPVLVVKASYVVAGCSFSPRVGIALVEYRQSICCVLAHGYTASFDAARRTIDHNLLGIATKSQFVCQFDIKGILTIRISDVHFEILTHISGIRRGLTFGRYLCVLAGQRLDFIELAAVNSICRIVADVALANIGNLVAAVVQAAVCQADFVVDGDTAVVHNSIPCRHAVQTFQVLGQTNFQSVSTIADYADIVGRGQFVFFCNAAFDIGLLVQVALKGCARIAAIYLAIIHGSYFVRSLSVGVHDTAGFFNAIYRRVLVAVQGLRTVVRGDIDRSTIAAIGTFRAGQANMAYAVFTIDGDSILTISTFDGDTVLAVDDDRGTIFTINADGTIFAICTFLADADVILQRNLQGAIIHAGGNSFVVAFHLDGIIQSFGNRSIVIISQSEGLAIHFILGSNAFDGYSIDCCIRMSGVFDFQIYLAVADSIFTIRSIRIGHQLIITDGIADSFQLIFCSSPAVCDILGIPGRIAQPSQIVAF